jgi:hypothetical protein
MNGVTALSEAELKSMRNPRQLLRYAARDFLDAATGQDHSDETAFEKCLRIKKTLDLLEANAIQKDSCDDTSLSLYCEWLLWQLYEDVPLRHNPFLSHWVEALQRLNHYFIAWEEAFRTDEPDTQAEEFVAQRILFIQMLLDGSNKGWLDSTVDVVSDELYDRWNAAFEVEDEPFNLQPYVRMLEEEGIYDAPASAPLDGDKHIHKLQDNTPPSLNNTSQDWKEDILRNLDNHPDIALAELSHLPLSLPTLDFLTTLLADRTLETHAIDPAPVINSCIQSMLRSVERMGQLPTREEEEDAGNVAPWGKDTQREAVQLLLLFIKSLIRKGLVGMEVLYFEIQEICVRYVWIREVREFRTWVEEGIEGDGMDERNGGG